MNKLAALAFVVASTSLALAQPAPAPAPTATTASGPVVVVSPAPVVVTQPAPAPVPAGPATTAAGAPQNANWQDVNHINGQLVPVGQENDYLKKYKRWNVSTNPIGWIIGSYGVSLSYGVNDNIAVRGDINYYSPPGQDGDYKVSGVEIGVGLPIYFRRTYQGLFLEPGIISRTFTDSYSCSDCSSTGETTNTTFGPQVLVGWHWTWASGLNFAIAAGAGRNWATKDTEYGEEEIFPNGYMRFGYAF